MTVNDEQDLVYLLNNMGVVFREKPELGLRFYQCVAKEPVDLAIPGEDDEGKTYEFGDILWGGGVLHRTIKTDTRFRPVPATTLLAQWPNLRILVVRSGGLGDVFMVLPAIAALKERFPQAQIYFSTAPHHVRLLQGNPVLSGVFDIFGAYDEAPFGLVVDLGFWAEAARESNEVHRSLVFAHAFGLDDLDDYSFRYYVTGEEREAVSDSIPEDRPLVALQVSGSISNRTPPVEWQDTMADLLLDRGYAIVVFGEERGTKWDDRAHILNRTGLPPLEILFATLERCAGIVAGDSGIMHAGNALGVPTVGLFGPIKPELRISAADQPRCRGVTGNVEANCPACNDKELHECTGYPRCMALMDHVKVLAALDEVMATEPTEGR